MKKEQIKYLTAAIHEIETTIINDKVSLFLNQNIVPKRAVWAVDYKHLLSNSKLHEELIFEVNSLFKIYGRELIEFLKENSPPLSVITAISVFIANKEKYKVKTLQSSLNQRTSEEKLLEFDLSQYLILGYCFYDGLYFTYFHRYQPEKFILWGRDDSDYYYEMNLRLEKSEDIAENKQGKSKRKYTPRL
jgi:hypothetical protein